MKISSIDEYNEHGYGIVESKMIQRQEILAKFPHSIVAEGNYPEIDFASHWLWGKIGPSDGKCWEHTSEYPGCPLVLATKGQRISPIGRIGIDWEEDWEFKNPGDHDHQGVWATFWLGKTNYDYGFMEWCFKQEDHLKLFADAVESLGFGPRYRVQ